MLRQCLMIALCFITLVNTSDVRSEEFPLDMPVTADASATYRFVLLSDSGYTDERGRSVIDVIEGYEINMALSVDTLDGKPVMGLEPKFELLGSSTLIPPGVSTKLTSTDESGILEFGIVAGNQGMDQLTVSYGENVSVVHFNIISIMINDFPTVQVLEDGLNWSELMQARIDFVDGELKITFPEIIKQQNGEKLKVSGFMMPLDPDIRQRHFLLTSSPPHCFFHIPGGPTGVIEVFSEKGIEASWEPVLIEGVFELVDAGKGMGIIYQMRDAEVVDE